RGEHHGRHAELLRGPGSRRAVVPGGRGDDSGRAAFPVSLECRERSAPLESAQLMGVFSLEIEPSPACDGGGRRLERRSLHCALLMVILYPSGSATAMS